VPVDEQVCAHRLRIDSIETGIPEVRHHERLVRQQVDEHRVLQVGGDVRHAVEHGSRRHRPLDVAVAADDAEVVLLVRDRAVRPVTQVEAEVRKP
jgi:hypothetical protein